VHRPVRRATLLALSLLLISTPAARAQYNEALPGARVRLTAPGVVAARYEGTVLAREPGVIQVGSPNTPPVNVPVDRITSLEISRGKSRAAGAWRGIVIGTPIGAVLGLVAATNVDSRTYYNYNTGRRDTTSSAAVVLWSAATGALFGAGIGALIPKERWERFEIAPRTGMDERRRMRVGVALGY
jgi:hypothetical protein